jgi:hypothetical protein
MWRGEKSQSNTWETDNYPPSLYGNGRINPTQNFVDAFPTANGYPITDSRSNYDPANPYANRDPRLSAYVVYDGSKVGVNNTVIHTAADADGKDGLNVVSGSSTRTGYYLRKLLRQDINLDPKVNSQQYHYTPRIRLHRDLSQLCRGGQRGLRSHRQGSHSYSAYDVVKALRSGPASKTMPIWRVSRTTRTDAPAHPQRAPHRALVRGLPFLGPATMEPEPYREQPRA